MNETIFLGTAVADLTAETNGLAGADADKAKEECRTIGLTIGGSAVNAASEYAKDSHSSPRLAAITGVDSLGNLISDILQRKFTRYSRIATASKTRLSLVVPHPGKESGTTKLYTFRPILDHAATLAAVRPWLDANRRLVVGSMSANDAELVERLIASHPGETYLIPTADQIADRERTMKLSRQATYVQLNNNN